MLNSEVFSDLGMSAEESGALVASIGALRRSAGDF